MENTQFIFDKVFKRILTLSSKSVINLINGLFGTTYPEDSTLTYNWTEHVDKDLKRTLSDTIITVNNANSYHLEAQIDKDDDIIFRVFSYGYHHAEHHRTSYSGNYCLCFPEPQIIYLHSDAPIPEKYTLHIRFGDSRVFDYEVPTINLKNISTQEYNERKLCALLPFKLLSLRKLFTARMKKITPDNVKQLQNLLFNDILPSIQRGKSIGIISTTDATELIELTHMLFNYLYGAYPETEEVRDMFDQSLHLEVDDLVIQYEDVITKYKDVAAKYDDMVAKYGDMAAKHDDMVAKYGDMAARHDDMVAKYSDMAARHDDMVTKYGDMAARHDDMVTKYGNMAAKHDGMVAKYGDMAAKHDGMVAKSNELAAALQEQEQSNLEKDRLLSQQNEQLSQMNAEIARLKAELAKRN